MGNAGSVDGQHTELRAHSVPLKLPMPEPGELEERFAVVLVSQSRPPLSAGSAEGPPPRGKGGAQPSWLGERARAQVGSAGRCRPRDGPRLLCLCRQTLSPRRRAPGRAGPAAGAGARGAAAAGTPILVPPGAAGPASFGGSQSRFFRDTRSWFLRGQPVLVPSGAADPGSSGIPDPGFSGTPAPGSSGDTRSRFFRDTQSRFFRGHRVLVPPGHPVWFVRNTRSWFFGDTRSRFFRGQQVLVPPGYPLLVLPRPSVLVPPGYPNLVPSETSDPGSSGAPGPGSFGGTRSWFFRRH